MTAETKFRAFVAACVSLGWTREDYAASPRYYLMRAAMHEADGNTGLASCDQLTAHELLSRCPNCGSEPVAGDGAPQCFPGSERFAHSAYCSGCYDGAPDSGAAAREIGFGATADEALLEWHEQMKDALA